MAPPALRFLAEPNPDLEEAREAIEDIISDGRRASAVLTRIRQLAKKSAPELDASQRQRRHLRGNVADWTRDCSEARFPHGSN